MPVGSTVFFRARVTAAPSVRGRLSGAVAGERPALAGAVSNTAATAEAGPSTLYGLEIWLGDHWVSPADFRGPIEISEDLDTVPVTFSFGLAGRRYAPQLTESTWTRTPVEVWATTGPPEGPLRRWQRAAGYVMSCDQSGDHEPTLKVTCGNASVIYDRVELCYELPPSAGLTRGAILRDMGLQAGLTVDVPEGALWSKPLVVDGKRLLDFFREFGEPEGWFWRFDGPVLRAYTADVAERPSPPDWTWTPAGWQTLSSRPPVESPSRWVVKGTRLAYVDESGLKTTVETTTIEGLFAPKAAAQKQLTDGSLVASGVTAPGETVQVISKLEDVTEERGGKLVRHVTREWGWYNPPAAKLRTGDSGDGPGPADGYWYAVAWVDPDGEYKTWPKERFVLVGERREIPTWSGDTQARQRTEVYGWRGRLMGVKEVGADEPSVLHVGVGSDDQSYEVAVPVPDHSNAIRQLAAFGLAEVQETDYHYGSTGAALREVLSVWTFVSPRVALEDNPGWVLFDGTGQYDLIQPWGLKERKTTLNLVRDGSLAGTIVTTEAYAVAKMISGVHDWGDFRANALRETFRTVRRETKRFRVRSEGQYEQVGADGETTLVAGRAPVPRYQGSPWTVLRQQPLEVLLDDPTAEAWFGPQTEALTNEYVQSVEEARALIARRRRRKLAHTHEVAAPRQPARCGDTVRMVSPGHGLDARCLVTRLRETWVLVPVTQITGNYSLEQPL